VCAGKESKTKTIIETTLNLKVINASAFFVCCSLGICFDGCFLPPYLRPPSFATGWEFWWEEGWEGGREGE
jgi:hypothetical protein